MQPEDSLRFQNDYSNVIRLHIDSLKKRERSKKAKPKKKGNTVSVPQA